MQRCDIPVSVRVSQLPVVLSLAVSSFLFGTAEPEVQRWDYVGAEVAAEAQTHQHAAIPNPDQCTATCSAIIVAISSIMYSTVCILC